MEDECGVCVRHSDIQSFRGEGTEVGSVEEEIGY